MERISASNSTAAGTTGTTYTKIISISVPSYHGIMITASAAEYSGSTRGALLLGYGTSSTPSTPSVVDTG